MKYFELDDEEKQLLEEIEKGEWQPVKNFAQRKKELIEIARNIPIQHEFATFLTCLG